MGLEALLEGWVRSGDSPTRPKEVGKSSRRAGRGREASPDGQKGWAGSGVPPIWPRGVRRPSQEGREGSRGPPRGLGGVKNPPKEDREGLGGTP